LVAEPDGGAGREEAESLIHDPSSDAVQLLTIHKSKGLEFPVVCLVNMADSVEVAPRLWPIGSGFFLS